MLKDWAAVHRDMLYELPGKRYIMYGEWMYAKHTVFYDALPHYFLEFDILDRETGAFLDTSERRKILQGLPVVSVPVLVEGQYRSLEDILRLMGRSRYISDFPRQHLMIAAEKLRIDPERCCNETDLSGMM